MAGRPRAELLTPARRCAAARRRAAGAPADARERSRSARERRVGGRRRERVPETHARWPSSVADRDRPLRSQELLDARRRIDLGSTSAAPRRAPSGPGVGVADELIDEHQGRASARRPCAAARGQLVRQRRERRADQPPLHAVCRVDQLLQLRPAEWLGEDARGVELGERVDADPVRGDAGEPAHQLPASAPGRSAG